MDFALHLAKDMTGKAYIRNSAMLKNRSYVSKEMWPNFSLEIRALLCSASEEKDWIPKLEVEWEGA